MFRERLNSEFAARKRINPRYSLRAFAAFLGTDHSTLSKVLKGSRRATSKQLRTMATKLGLSAEEIAVHVAAEQVEEAPVVRRQAMLRHWTAEALALLSDSSHWKIVRLCREPAFHADCHWLAAQVGVTVDEINVALTRLLRLELIDGGWRDQTGLAELTEANFRRLALTRIRKKAAEDRIEFRLEKRTNNGKSRNGVSDYFEDTRRNG